MKGIQMGEVANPKSPVGEVASGLVGWVGKPKRPYGSVFFEGTCFCGFSKGIQKENKPFCWEQFSDPLRTV